MKHFSRIILVGLGLGLLAIALSFIPNHPAAAAPGPTPVVVQNTVANPVPVSGSVSVSGAGSPISAVLCEATGGGCGGGSGNGYAVPSGSHLIIDYTSGRCVLETGGSGTASAYDPELNYTQGGTLFSHSVAPSLIQQTTSSFLVFSWAQSTQIYADPSTTVYLVMGLADTGSGSASCTETISGRLVSP
jgi:hypothetical protein